MRKGINSQPGLSYNHQFWLRAFKENIIMPAPPHKKMKNNKGGEDVNSSDASPPQAPDASPPQDLSKTASTVVLQRREESPSSQFLRTLEADDQVTTVIQKELVTPANYTPKKKRSGVPELQIDISKRYLIEDGCIASAVKKVWKGVGEAGPYQTMKKFVNFEKEYGSGKPFSFNIGYDAIGYLIACLTEIQAETDKFLEEEKEKKEEAATSDLNT